MRSLTMFSALLAASIAAGSLGHAQSTEPTSKTGGSASEEEVNQLRIEVTAQRKTIEELKTLVEKLVDAKTEATGYNPVAIRPAAAPATAEIPAEEINALPVSAPDGGTAHLVKTVLVQPDPVIEAAMSQMLRSIATRGLGAARPADGPVVLHPGAGSGKKCWPAERFLQLADRLRESGRSEQVILGEVELERWDKNEAPGQHLLMGNRHALV